MKVNNLKHHVKNLAGCAGRIFGQDAMIFDSLSKVHKHMERRETSCSYEFRQENFFEGSFLDKLNRRLHRFLDYWAGGIESEIDTKKLDTADMLDQVEMKEYHAKVPGWIPTILKSRKQHPDEDGRSGGHGGGGNRDDGGGHGKKSRQFIGDDCKNENWQRFHLPRMQTCTQWII